MYHPQRADTTNVGAPLLPSAMSRIQFKVWRAPHATLSQPFPRGLNEGEIGIASETNTLYKRPDGDATGALIPISDSGTGAGGGGNATSRITAVATTHVTPSGLQTVDGVALLPGNMVLLTAQADPSQNGLYTAASAAWTRVDPSTDSIGSLLVVETGTAHAGSTWLYSDEGGFSASQLAVAGGKLAATQVTATGLTLTGDEHRITGDFSSPVYARRVMFQTSVANATTAVGALPSGAGVGGSFVAFDHSVPAHSAFVQMFVGSDVGMAGIRSGASGAGDPLPLKFLTGAEGLERVVIETNGSTWFKGGVFGQRTVLSSGMSTIDLSVGSFFAKEITSTTSFTVTGVPVAGASASFVLDITNGGAYAVTWWRGTGDTAMKWAGGTAPTLTASGRDVLGFFTHDGGVTWTGLVLGKDVR